MQVHTIPKYTISIIIEFSSGVQGILNFNSRQRQVSEITDYQFDDLAIWFSKPVK